MKATFRQKKLRSDLFYFLIIFIGLMAFSYATAQSPAESNSRTEHISNPPTTNVQSKTVVNKASNATPCGISPICLADFSPTKYINLPEGKSSILDLQQLHIPGPAKLCLSGDPEVVQIDPLFSATPRNTFFLFGKHIGSTNLMFQTKEGNCSMVEVTVALDTASVHAKLVQLLPDEKLIKVSAAADSLILSGTATDSVAADQAVAIAHAYLRKDWRAASNSAAAGSSSSASSGGSGNSAANDRIINLLTIAAAQQVMLEVKVAEVSKTLLDKLGVGISARTSGGSWAYTLLSNFLTGNAGGVLNGSKTNGSQLTVDAEHGDALIRLLAEPNVMAISGQEGSFLAGGKIFIPVPQSNGGITLAEREFGIGLKFTPTVLSGGRINIKVSPEVSELSPIGASFSGQNGNISSILPLITTRRAATTVQLHDGQSFAIGGLIKNTSTTNIKGIPMLGEIPVLGSLFRSTAFQQDKTELLFVITPHLVKPLPADYALPTDAVSTPSRSELFLMGQTQSQRATSSKDSVKPATPLKQEPAPPLLNHPSGFDLK